VTKRTPVAVGWDAACESTLRQNARVYVFEIYLPEILEKFDPEKDWSIRAPKAFYLRYRFVQHRFTATMLPIEVE
jgi:hypothetical protein